ncbi:hypothetical protein D3C76_935160 [compost metagenome]
MQDDRLQACRYLDRTNRVATVDDIRRIGARTKRLLARLETQRATALEAIADSVRLGPHRPGIAEEVARGRRRQAVVVQTGHHPQQHLPAQTLPQGHRQAGTCAAFTAGHTHRQQVARHQLAPLPTSQRAQPVGGATAQHLRDIDATGHRQIGARAGAGEVKAQHLPGADLERRVRILLHPVQAHRHLRAAHRHQGIGLELQLRPHQGAFQPGCADRVADQLVSRAQRILVERTRWRDTQVVVAFTAQVLHRGGQAGFEYLDHASTSCSDLG